MSKVLKKGYKDTIELMIGDMEKIKTHIEMEASEDQICRALACETFRKRILNEYDEDDNSEEQDGLTDGMYNYMKENMMEEENLKPNYGPIYELVDSADNREVYATGDVDGIKEFLWNRYLNGNEGELKVIPKLQARKVNEPMYEVHDEIHDPMKKPFKFTSKALLDYVHHKIQTETEPFTIVLTSKDA